MFLLRCKFYVHQIETDREKKRERGREGGRETVRGYEERSNCSVYEQVETGEDGWKIRFLQPNERRSGAEGEKSGKATTPSCRSVCTLLTFCRELPNETYFSPSPGQSVHRWWGGSEWSEERRGGEPASAGSGVTSGINVPREESWGWRFSTRPLAERYSRAGHVHDTALHSNDTRPPTWPANEKPLPFLFSTLWQIFPSPQPVLFLSFSQLLYNSWRFYLTTFVFYVADAATKNHSRFVNNSENKTKEINE